MTRKYSGPVRFMIVVVAVIAAWLLIIMTAGAVITLAKPSTVDPDPTTQPWSMNQ